MKISNCRSYGAIVIVEGTSVTEVDIYFNLVFFFYSILNSSLIQKLKAKEYALKLSKMFGLMYING